jgi:flagellar motor switch protein FliG
LGDFDLSHALLKKFGIHPPPRLQAVEFADAKSLAIVLSKEHPQTAALAVAFSPKEKAAEILRRLPESMRNEVMVRVANLENVSPNEIELLDEALTEAIRRLPPPDAQRYGGPDTLAKMIAAMEPGLQRDLLDRLAERDPALSDEITKRLVNFSDILRIQGREIGKLIQRFPARDWAIALKNVGDQVRQHILQSMPERLAAELTEEIASLPPMRLSEVNAIQSKIIESMREFLADDLI